MLWFPFDLKVGFCTSGFIILLIILLVYIIGRWYHWALWSWLEKIIQDPCSFETTNLVIRGHWRFIFASNLIFHKGNLTWKKILGSRCFLLLFFTPWHMRYWINISFNFRHYIVGRFNIPIDFYLFKFFYCEITIGLRSRFLHLFYLKLILRRKIRWNSD